MSAISVADNEYEMKVVAPFYLFTFYVIMLDTENDTGGPHQSLFMYLLFFAQAFRGPALKKIVLAGLTECFVMCYMSSTVDVCL